MKKKKIPPSPEFLKRIDTLKELSNIQCSKGNWDCNEYMRGMANGMILAISILENKPNPKYMNPKKKS